MFPLIVMRSRFTCNVGILIFPCTWVKGIVPPPASCILRAAGEVVQSYSAFRKSFLGLQFCLCSDNAARWLCSSSVVFESRIIGKGDLDPGGNNYQLWQDLFSNPSEWWDNRLDKRSPGHPDFRHRRTREPLWLTHQCKPEWVDSRLASLDAQLKRGAEVQSLCKQGQLDKALDVLLDMDGQGIVLSVDMYRALLRSCSQSKSLGQAKRVLTHLTSHGLEPVLGEYMVLTLVRCSGLDDALQVFDRLPQRTTLSWTAVISGYTRAGQGRKALRTYHCMLEEGLEPDKNTFVSLLRACGSIADLAEGKRIHAEAFKYRCESDLHVGTCVVDMYAQCGSIECAKTMFDLLFQRDVVVWTTMLAAYGQQSQAEKALLLYEQMQEECVSPDIRTFVGVLQASAALAEKEDVVDGQAVRLKSLGKAKAIHAHARRKGFDSDVFVGNTMVTVYGKCGSVVDAQNVFDGLSYRDVVSWTAMLAAYSQQGQPEKALKLYQLMLEDGISPTDVTLVVLSQACGVLGDKVGDVGAGHPKIGQSLGQGKAVHAEAWRKGYKSHLTIGNTLISMYGKCGSPLDARTVFSNLPHRNVVSWSAMIVAYAQQNQAEEALHLYEQMRDEVVSPNHVTFVSVLQACGILAEQEDGIFFDTGFVKPKSLEMGKAIHAVAWSKGYGFHVGINTTLISMYGRCGSVLDAVIVFDGMSQQDVVLWNAMMGACVQQGQGEMALQLYAEMRQVSMVPNDVTFVIALQACGMVAEKEEGMVIDGEFLRVESLQKGMAIHADAQRMGYYSDFFVGNTLVSMYRRCGSIVNAENVFDGLPHRTVVSWNVMLAAYVEQGQPEAAFQLYRQMEDEGMHPDEITLVYILQACCNAGRLEMCRQVHLTVMSATTASSPLVANTLIHAYGRCASMGDAQTVFDALPQPDVVSWTALIAGYAREGDYMLSLHWYEQMRLAGTKPNEVTFLSVLCACSHAGLVDKGVEYFESMSTDYGLAPQIEHYVSMVDLLGRAGYFTSIRLLLSTMPVQPNLPLWLCLLGACRKHGKVMLAQQAFDCAVRLQPKDCGAYVLMSNIYADAGLWDCAKDVNVLERSTGAWKKPPGKSWIEHERQVHTFLVGDQKHPQQERLYGLLGDMLVDEDLHPHVERVGG